MHLLTVVVMAGGLLVAGCERVASPPSSASVTTGRQAALPPRSAAIGEVTVRVEPTHVGADGAAVELSLDTHTATLDLALPSGTTLTVAGRAWPAVAWDGDGAGGHHPEGTLRFAAGGPPQGAVELSIRGLARPGTFRWTVLSK